MLMRIYILAIAISYFISWAAFSNWSLYNMLFNHEPTWYGAFARLAAAALVLIGTAFTMAQP